MSKVMKRSMPIARDQRGRADHAGRGAGENRAHRFVARESRADRAAVGLHHAQPRAGEPRSSFAEMRRHPRRDVRVDHRGREAARTRDTRRGFDARPRAAGPAARARARARFSLFGIGVGMEQADGERVGAAAQRQRGARARVRRAVSGKRDLAVEVECARRRRSASRARTSGSGRDGRQRVQLVAVLPADLDQILEAGVGEQRDARALALEQRVGRDGRAVSDQIGSRAPRVPPRVLSSIALSPPITARGRIVGRREHLVHAQVAADDRDQVGEGAAGVDSDDDESWRITGFSKILKFGELRGGSKGGWRVVERKVAVDQRARIDLCPQPARRAPAQTGRIASRRS